MKKKLFQLLRDLYYIARFTIMRHQRMVYLFGCPGHTNMGDHAMVFGISNFFKRNFPKYGIVCLTVHHYDACVKFLIKHCLRNNDVIAAIGGNHIGDRYHELDIYKSLISILPPPKKLFVFPQTVCFENKTKLLETAHIFNNRGNVVLLCRDYISYQTAIDYFTNCSLYLFPDIVTLNIGTATYKSNREGILFCLRKDVEVFYTEKEMKQFIERFSNVKYLTTDTFITQKTGKYVVKHREKCLNEIWGDYSKYKVVVTDRFHGVIFSLIANTPVVALSSVDHKLKSSMKWFETTPLAKYVTFANNLEEAYLKTNEILESSDYNYTLPPYFKEKYEKQLVDIIKEELNVS